MGTIKSFLYMAATIGMLAACSNENGQVQDSGTPGLRHYLTEAQVIGEETKAKAGDTKAVARLINHYQWAVSDRDKALFWLRSGAELGDHFAMINLSSQLAEKSNESDCKEADALLVSVLNSTPTPEVAKIATADLRTLREGVDGTGYCTKWLLSTELLPVQ